MIIIGAVLGSCGTILSVPNDKGDQIIETLFAFLGAFCWLTITIGIWNQQMSILTYPYDMTRGQNIMRCLPSLIIVVVLIIRGFRFFCGKFDWSDW